MITVSLLSSITSSTAVTVAVPVVCPAAIAIDVVQTLLVVVEVSKG